MIAPQRMIDEARKLVGVPWRHQGRTPNGVDCIGMVLLSARHAGLDLVAVSGVRDLPVYQRQPDPRLISMVTSACVKTDTPLAGALVLFKFDGDKFPRHMGLLTHNETVIHADARARRCVIEHGYRMHWRRWTHSLWLLPGVEYGQ